MVIESTIGNGLELLSPEDHALRHLSHVLPLPILPYESIEIRCLDTLVKPARPGPRLFVATIEEAVEAAMRNRQRWDVFFGVGTRSCPGSSSIAGCPHEEKGADHVSRLGTIWGDFDVKEGGNLDELRVSLLGLSLPPTVIVGSGKGLHCYWPLTEPTRELARVESVNKSLRLRFGADNAIDSARILRVAGTLNRKYGMPLPVRLLVAPDV